MIGENAIFADILISKIDENYAFFHILKFRELLNQEISTVVQDQFWKFQENISDLEMSHKKEHVPKFLARSFQF